MEEKTFEDGIVSPHVLKTLLCTNATDAVLKNRQEIERILSGNDEDRLLLIVGPCSIHDELSCLDYAKRLLSLQKKYGDKFFIVMRCYLEKSRTALGWSGFLSAPNIGKSFAIEEGLRRGRSLLIKIVEAGLPIAYEVIDPLVLPYFYDLISIASIGARSVRSQIYRYLASSLSFPVLFKNAIEGDIVSPCDSIVLANKQHSFLSINEDGRLVNVCATGNKHAYLTLRGFRKDGVAKQNYDFATLNKVKKLLKERDLPLSVVVDASHDNSNRIPPLQEKVFFEVLQNKLSAKQDGASAYGMVHGIMLESFIKEGSISEEEYIESNEYGISITDPCIGWERTEKIIKEGYNMLSSSDKNDFVDGKLVENKTKPSNESGNVKRKDYSKLDIYTDGACSGNPGRGGWGFVIVEGKRIITKKSGFDEATTNNRMEMQAVIEALKEIEGMRCSCDRLTVYTDSSYVKNGITVWIKKWKSNGWRSSSNSPVKNQDLWLTLDSLSSSLSLSWCWVKGHAGNEFNEMCDRMATSQAQKVFHDQTSLDF